MQSSDSSQSGYPPPPDTGTSRKSGKAAREQDIPGARLDESSKLVRTAMARLGSVCAGNGIRKKDIAVKQAKGRIFLVKARVVVEPDTQTQSHERKGKVSGDKVFQSKGDMEAALEDLKTSLTRNRNIFQTIVSQIQKRPDKGIGLDNKTLNLKTLDQSYIYYEPCQSCHQQGHTTCPRCHGHQQIPCIRCQGRQNVQCAVCGGRGSISGPDNGQKSCPRCQGRQQIPCEYCHGHGRIKCDRCGGAGKSKCGNCGGAGVNSHITEIQLQASISCSYEIDNPQKEETHELEEILEESGPDLILQKMAKISTSESEQDERGLPVLNYALKVPHARLSLAVKKKEISALLTGYSGRFSRMPALLDSFLSPAIGFASSKKAKAAPISALNKLGRIKIFRQAMTLTAKASVNVAADKLGKKYKGFIHPDSPGKIALQTNILLDKASRKPRIFAAGMTGFLAGGLCAGFYFGPGLDMTARAVAPHSEALLPTLPWIGVAELSSFLLLALLWAGAGFVNKIFSRAYFKARTGKILPADYAGLFLSRLGRANWLPYGVVTLIFMIFYLAYRQGIL